MKVETTRHQWSQRKLGPVKLLKKRSRKSVATSFEDLQRIKHNAELMAARQLAHESSYFTSNF